VRFTVTVTAVTVTPVLHRWFTVYHVPAYRYTPAVWLPLPFLPLPFCRLRYLPHRLRLRSAPVTLRHLPAVTALLRYRLRVVLGLVTVGCCRWIACVVTATVLTAPALLRYTPLLFTVPLPPPAFYCRSLFTFFGSAAVTVTVPVYGSLPACRYRFTVYQLFCCTFCVPDLLLPDAFSAFVDSAVTAFDSAFSLPVTGCFVWLITLPPLRITLPACHPVTVAAPAVFYRLVLRLLRCVLPYCDYRCYCRLRLPYCGLPQFCLRLVTCCSAVCVFLHVPRYYRTPFRLRTRAVTYPRLPRFSGFCRLRSTTLRYLPFATQFVYSGFHSILTVCHLLSSSILF